MVIRISMVPSDHPLSLSFVIPPTVMNATDGSLSLPYQFETPIKCDCKIRRIEDDIFIQSRTQGCLTPNCDRCLAPFDYLIDREDQFTCQPLNHPATDLDEEGDLYYFHGAELDIAPIVREMILLDLPMQYRCSESCKGLCGDCGLALSDVGECAQCAKNQVFPQKIIRL